jgi:hypothetical protein
MDKELITALELWNSLKNYVPVKDRQSAADHALNTMMDLGIDVESHDDELQESCDYLYQSLCEFQEQSGDCEVIEDLDE